MLSLTSPFVVAISTPPFNALSILPEVILRKPETRKRYLYAYGRYQSRKGETFA